MQKIDILSEISKVKQEEWDRLITTNVFATHAWLKTVENSFIGDIRPLYVLVREDEKLAGLTVCYIFRKTGTVEDLDDRLFGRAKPLVLRFGISFMPAMVCGTLWGCGDYLVAEPGAHPERKQAIMNKLLDVIEGEANRNRLPLHLIDVPGEDLDLAALLRRRGYNQSRHVPMTFLDLRWPSFSEYTNHLDNISPNIRKELKRKINKNRKSGTTISILENVNEHVERLYELMTMNYRKHLNLPFCFSKNFFSELKRNLGQNVILHISRKGDDITGLAVEFRYKRTSHGLLLGIDHEKCGNDMTYFNLGYYSPIAEAISAGMTRFYFGPGHYLMKRRLGCRTTDHFNWHKSQHFIAHQMVKLWFAILSNWNRYKLPRQVRLPQDPKVQGKSG